MTRNIGTFTAAGVDLKTSTLAIKGIANLAAGSGSSAQQASTAMYQLSQALAAGKVQLMDWNSVVNAGMGGELFQKALEKTARELGHGRDMSVSFRDSLQDGWITTAVLTKTLEKFANDKSLIQAATQVKTLTQMFDTMKESVQSGWATTWENIIGNKDQAAALFTGINNGFSAIVGASANARNAMLAFWSVNGGRTALIQGIANAFEGLSTVLEPIEKAFREIFPPMAQERLVEITKSFRDLMANFKIGEGTANNLRRTFAGVFALLDIGKQLLTAVAKGLSGVIKYLLPAGDGLLSFTGSIGDWLVALDKAIKEGNVFTKAIDAIGSVLKPIANVIKNVVVGIINAFKSLSQNADLSGLSSFSDAVQKILSPFTKLGTVIENVFGRIGGVFKKMEPIFTKIGNVISTVFNKIRDNIAASTDNLGFDSIIDLVNGGLLSAILVGLSRFVGSLTSIAKSAKGFVKGITGILDGVKGCLAAYQAQLKAETLIKIATAMAILAASLIALSMINPEKLTYAMAAMTAMFADLFGAMAIFDKVMDGDGFKGMGKVTIVMIGMSAAILILSNALVKMGDLNWEEIAKGLTAVTVLAGVLVASSKLLQSSSGSLIKGGLGFIFFGSAVMILGNSLKSLSTLDLASLGKGLLGIGGLAAELALFLKTADLDKMGILKGAGLLLLANSIKVLASVVQTFGSLDTGMLVQGLAAVGVILTEVGLFTKLTGNATKVISTSVGLTLLGAAMLLFTKSIGNLGNMSWEVLGKGLLGMSGALIALTVALRLMPKTTVLTALGLTKLAGALLAMVGVIQLMGKMSMEVLAKGLLALAASLGIIVVAMKLLESSVGGSAAILIMSASLTVMAGVLEKLGNLSLAQIGKGLLSLVGIFTVMGLAALVLAPLTPVILALSAAVGLLGIGVVAISAGLMAFSVALTALAAAGAAGVAVLILAIKQILELIPLAMQKFGEGIISFARVLADNGPVLLDAMTTLLNKIIDAIIDVTPKVAKALILLLADLLKTLAEYVPEMARSGMELILGVLKGIADNIGEIVATGIDIVVNFIEGIASKIPDVIQAGVDMILAYINGLADAIRKDTPLMIDAVDNLMTSMVEAAAAWFKHWSDIGGNLVDGLVQGLKDNINSAVNAANDLGSFVINAAKKTLGVHSPSTLFKEIGNNLTKGLTLGINDGSGQAVDASKSMSEDVTKASSGVVKKSNASAKSAFDKAVDWIDERKYYNKLSLKEELTAWEDLQKKYKIGSEERKKADREVYRVKQELIKEAQDAEKASYDKSSQWIQDEKYYKRLSLEDELAAWERVQARYKEGTEERKNADKEVYRVKQELIQRGLDDEKTAFDKSVQWIQDQKDFNKLTLAEELEAWKRIQQQYAEGTEERKQADKEVYDLEKQINDINIDYQQRILDLQSQTNEKRRQLEQDYANDVRDINDQLAADIASANREYEDAVKNRTQTLYDSYGLFDKPEVQKPVKGTDLLNNLQGQVDQFEDWQKNIDELAKKGIDEGLLEELRKMGPAANAQIKALNGLTDEDLQKYVDLWKTKNSDAKDQAITELEDLRAQTDAKIAELNANAATRLSELRSNFQSNLDAINADEATQLTALQTEWSQKIGALTTETKTQFDTMSTKIQGTVKELSTNTTKEFTTLAGNIQTEMKTPDWNSVGVYIVDGMTEGVRSRATALANEAAAVALAALNAAKQALGINSPSKEFAKVGRYADEGFIAGLKNFSSNVETAAANVGVTAISALRSTISKISDAIDSGMDTSPVIRPVLDLSELQNGSNTIASLLSQKPRINVASIADRLPSIGQTGTSNPQTTQTPSAGASVSFTQNNYSPKPLSRLDIYRQTRNQISSLKGLVV
jgi:tape measure domain-containing protein